MVFIEPNEASIVPLKFIHSAPQTITHRPTIVAKIKIRQLFKRRIAITAKGKNTTTGNQAASAAGRMRLDVPNI